MTRPTATCELYVNNTRVPDTGQQLIAAEPTVLDGLSLTWGRDGQNEQPGPATCSFTILDRYAESDFLDRLHVGSPVALWAQGEIPDESGGGPTYIQTMDDGTLETWPLGDTGRHVYYSSAAIWTSSTVVDDGGSHVWKGVAKYQSQSNTILFPPREFSPDNELPNAWDDIPRLHVGDQSWQLSARVKAPAGHRIYIRGTRYQEPYGAAASIDSTQYSMIVATGDWQTITLSGFRIASQYPYDSAWIGLTLQVWYLSDLFWRGASGTWAEQSGTWADIAAPILYADNLFIGRRAGEDTTRRVLSFSGSVTDVIATPYGNGDTLNLAVTAADLGSDLGNRVIGDEPWPVQTLATRADRIAQLAGITTSPRVRIDDPLGALQVSYRDIDAQPSYALLQDLAQTGGGVLWAATHAVTGPYLWIENPADRASLRELTLSGSLIMITGATNGVTIMSACDLLEDPISWRQDTADVSTVVAVTWLEQGTDDEGKVTTTERTETVSDPTAVTTYGTRRLSISTELVKQADAISIANRALATARAVPWRIEGLTFDTDSTFQELDTVDDASREIALLNLLDGTTRMGLAVTLVDMPDYAPRGSISDVYVEGGRYAYEGGAWTLALNATPSGGQGTSATWGEIDAAWLWLQWSPAVTWQDLYGVAA